METGRRGRQSGPVTDIPAVCTLQFMAHWTLQSMSVACGPSDRDAVLEFWVGLIESQEPLKATNFLRLESQRCGLEDTAVTWPERFLGKRRGNVVASRGGGPPPTQCQ